MLWATEANGAPPSPAVAEPDLSRLCDRARVGVLVVDRQGTVLWASDALLRLLGYAWDEYVGHPLTGLLTQGGVVDAEEALRRGANLREHEATLRHRDGSVVHVLITSTSCREAGADGHSCYLIQDVTRHRRAERRLAAQI